MSTPIVKLKHPPIVEAVIEIDCDYPPGFDLAAVAESARDAFGDSYPNRRQQFVQEHHFAVKPDEPPQFDVKMGGLQALQFVSADALQLVQVRLQGFAFNRLAPYTSLDDYLPEIERTWRLFLGLSKPRKVRRICLRYINRIPLPLTDGAVRFEDFLAVSPRLPDEEKLRFLGFLRQQTALEEETGNEVTLVLTTQPPEAQMLPLLFEIVAGRLEDIEADRWDLIRERLESLRGLKNRVFHNTLTTQCLNLFQQ